MGNTVEDKMVEDKMGKESSELSLLQRVKTGGGTHLLDLVFFIRLRSFYHLLTSHTLLLCEGTGSGM